MVAGVGRNPAVEANMNPVKVHNDQTVVRRQA